MRARLLDQASVERLDLQREVLRVDAALGEAAVEVVAAAARQILELPPGPFVAVIEAKATTFERLEERPVELLGVRRGELVRAARERKRHRRGDEIAILEWRTFAIEAVDQLRARLDVDDQRGRTLDNRHLSAARVKILRDVMAAIAGADDDCSLAAPGFAIRVLARVQHLAAEIGERGDVLQIGNATHTGRQHDMGGMHLVYAVGAAAQAHGPAPSALVVAAAEKLGVRPVIELERFDV